MFAQDTALAGQFVQQWKLRMRAQEATMKGIANSNLRRLLAGNKSCNCADIDGGDTAQSRKSSPRYRGPAEILEIDETGVTASFQSQTFKVAR